MMSRCSILLMAVLLAACGSGGGGATITGPVTTDACNANIASTPQSLSAAEVERVLAQAVDAAGKVNAKATVAVVDRVGNVLAVYRMQGAGQTVAILSGNARNGAASPQGLDGLTGLIGSDLAAIAKATGGSQ